MTTSMLLCRDERRRNAVRAKPKLNGLDYLEVSEDQLTLSVYFLGKAPENISKDNIRISGGQRVTKIAVLSIDVQREQDLEMDDCMQVKIYPYGDFSTYTFCLVDLDEQGRQTDLPLSGFDPRYVCLDINFKVSCPSDLDCKQTPICPSEPAPIPEINYLAKDYASFRQLIYDRLALVSPDWQERHVPDLGVALVELLAYVGDQLSYYQDAVATEAYLDTARQRISVRRHVRLVDYRLHEGCNARAWVCLTVSQDISLKADDFYVLTSPDTADREILLKQEELPKTLPRPYLIYEPLVEKRQSPIELFAANNSIPIYTWGDAQCCLVKGATSATLADPGETEHQLKLKICDVLIFEEVKGSKTGNPADADPAHRHAVRVTSVENSTDPLTGQFIVEIEWSRDDALPFAVCVSAIKQDDCSLIDNISVVYGNVLLVDHGESISEELEPVPGTTQLPDCDDRCGLREAVKLSGWYRPTLTRAELSFSQRLPNCYTSNSCGPLPRYTPASSLLKQDVRKALAQLELYEIPSDDHCKEAGAVKWNIQADLLDSRDDDRHFVAEVNDDRQVQLRFGANEMGRAPTPGTRFMARYRIGNSPVGNVGAGTITHVVFRNNLNNAIIQVRNPLPAQGGTSPEALAEARLLAPHAFRDTLQRAITADDYAQIVRRDFAGKVQKASATLSWTGSGYEVLVAVDPYAASEACPQLLCEIDRHLRRYRRIGHDVQVVVARYVALHLEMKVCVLPGYLQAHVKAALLDAFSNRLLANGQRGFFHPDNLSFGDGVYLSKLVAAAQAVTGVENVTMTVFNRLYAAPDNALENGLLPLAAMEIARLDNDPNFPENGKLVIKTEGGR
ncbi:MAG: putative baseplate assembly protein [Methylobacter sp.]|uniref:Baseplate assembly protein n=1 Tax=Candidatus Methylobacter titanis TaxID=3053457 RepID=A0AA43Q574_9GAMM|nr:putative baseplate assembly protein [Candidatus Methylobacter titanis]